MKKTSLSVDINTLKYEVLDRSKGKIRIYLGEFVGEQFNVTIDTIKNMEPIEQTKMRSVIKSIILSDYSIIY